MKKGKVSRQEAVEAALASGRSRGFDLSDLAVQGEGERLNEIHRDVLALLMERDCSPTDMANVLVNVLAIVIVCADIDRVKVHESIDVICDVREMFDK